MLSLADYRYLSVRKHASPYVIILILTLKLTLAPTLTLTLALTLTLTLILILIEFGHGPTTRWVRIVLLFLDLKK